MKKILNKEGAVLRLLDTIISKIMLRYYNIKCGKSICINKIDFMVKGLNDISLGHTVSLNNVKIKIQNQNNTIKIGNGVVMDSSVIQIDGNNNSIIVGDYCNLLGMNVYIVGDDNKVLIGNNVIINALPSRMTCINVLGGKSITIGDGSLLSNDIQMHTTDYHKIYNKNNNVINTPKNIVIGKHVWIGFGVTILKGSQVGDGSIIGANSLLCGKYYEKNSIYAGVPANVRKCDIHWDY